MVMVTVTVTVTITIRGRVRVRVRHHLIPFGHEKRELQTTGYLHTGYHTLSTLRNSGIAIRAHIHVSTMVRSLRRRRWWVDRRAGLWGNISGLGRVKV